MKQSLYIVVFDTGLVKIGACESASPQTRIAVHTRAGRAFSHSVVHHDHCFIEGNVYYREMVLCQKIGKLASLVTGKEWFKFSNAAQATEYVVNNFKVDCSSDTERAAQPQTGEK